MTTITWEKALELGQVAIEHGFIIKPGTLCAMSDSRCYKVDKKGYSRWVSDEGETTWEHPQTKLPIGVTGAVPDFRDLATLGLLMLQAEEEGISLVFRRIIESVTGKI